MFFKNHIGLYIPPQVIEEHVEELKNYETSKGTVRFPIDKPISKSLVKKLIIARLKINEKKTGN